MRAMSLTAANLAVAAVITVLNCGPLRAQTPAPDVPPAAAATQDAAPPVTTPDTAQPPAAQDAAPPAATGRFIFSRVDGGILRLDSLSGQVTLCSQRSAGWVCQAVPEERAAFDSEVMRLTAEVDSLKAEIAALRARPAPPRPPAELAPRGDQNKTSVLKLPTDEDIKWARAAIEKVWRQFVDMVADFQKDVQRKG
jgi:hypothetical protein